ncbi:MAG: amidase, partial [Patescibacteria group bacterium]
MLIDKSLSELLNLLKNKEVKSEEIIDESITQIKMHGEKINAFITVVDPKIKIGLPYVMKDSYLTKGIRTTCASNILKNFIAPYSATVYEKLAHMTLVGKMNMDAWGHGGSSENTNFGPVKNPWDLTRVAGGSSGGPAAAVAARLVPFAIGEDTGGSIRNPA